MLRQEGTAQSRRGPVRHLSPRVLACARVELMHWPRNPEEPCRGLRDPCPRRFVDLGGGQACWARAGGAGVKSDCASTRKARRQPSSQESPCSTNPLPLLVQTNFETPLGSRALLRDPEATPPPSRPVTNRTAVLPSMPNQKSLSHPCPSPRGRVAGSLRLDPGMWAESIFNVTGELLLRRSRDGPIGCLSLEMIDWYIAQ